jgi:hypothetical protein
MLCPRRTASFVGRNAHEALLSPLQTPQFLKKNHRSVMTTHAPPHLPPTFLSAAVLGHIPHCCTPHALPPSTSLVAEGEAREARAWGGGGLHLCPPSSAPVDRKESLVCCAWSVRWTVALDIPLTRACWLLEFPTR